MAAKKSPAPQRTDLMLAGRLHPEWSAFFQQLLTKAETQEDASHVSGIPTGAEFNAFVDKFNALIDKLQAAGIME